ncbi:MAG: hypothetical protein H6766_01350 [Candidatus Peribacteria bacterium]|nr:MAG: hypothetical protein H6766_01350 [Candidatus Peribacteria bacterium]
MYYHINAFKQTDKKKYQLDFALEGDFDVIKEWLEEKEIITLGIEEISEENSQKIGTIHATIFHQADQQNHTLITHHDNIAQACLLLMFLGFDVRAITDTNKPLPPEQSDRLIALVREKINQQQEKNHQQQEKEQGAIHKQFEDERLLKLKAIAEQTQIDIQQLTTKVSGTISPNIIRQLEDISGDLQKLTRGTNANTISITLKKAFSLMEDIELQVINNSKEQEIHLIKDSLISNIDVLNEYNKRQKASQIKKVGEKSTDPSDKYYLFFGKIGIYTKFLHKEYMHKLSQNNYITQTIVTVINYMSILLPLLPG